MLYIGSDHRGFELKEHLKKWLEARKLEFFDVGATEFVKDDDYPDYAEAVAKSVAAMPAENKGILICGSGHGVDMVANKFKGVRSALCFNKAVAIQSREHEDANILALPSDWLKPEEAEEILNAWLNTSFGGAERNIRRIKKIKNLEKIFYK